ncbi:MAG: response regulator [Cellvibrio sp.]|uniref:response regulator n=1 Tax=Cellvibrio sp. TaxID=1965322 RepID=UPI0031A874A3
MFSKQELQVIGQTLLQRRDWLTKNINKPELANSKAQNERTLQSIESSLSKISAQLRDSSGEEVHREQVNHYISQPTVSPIRQAALARRQELVPGQIRVLLVDDDQVICELVAAYLQAAGIHLIDFANDGMRGISMMYEANPIYDLVLCDWNMPSKSGIEVHSAMRAAERYMATVFMLVTAVSEAKQIRSAIEDGVDDYVVKPIEQDKLLKKIARFFPHIKPGDAN